MINRKIHHSSFQTVKSRFSELLQAVHQQAGQVVLLIDEYDKPIVHYLESNHLKKAIAQTFQTKNARLKHGKQ